MVEHPELERAFRHADAFLRSLASRPVGIPVDAESLREALGGTLPDRGEDATEVIDRLATAADRGLVASAGPRYFGFVIGGSLPATLAADWLTSAWDQNAGLFISSPAASVVEEIAGAWLLDLLRLPAGCSVGFVTGATMANFTALAAARHEVLRRAGWDVEADGLRGAPDVQIVAGAEVHVTIVAALRMLGLGSRRVRLIDVDGQGRMRLDALRRVLSSCTGPTIVCAQAGNVNTGAFDPFEEIVGLAHQQGAWVHVDGAFGLWAAATPSLASSAAGVERADSWALDAHKWLNVPYDNGIAIVAHPAAHRASMSATASYLVTSTGSERDPYDFTPEFSRRARGFTVYAALRVLGRQGVVDLVERCCQLARRVASRLQVHPGVEILNEVVLNQVLVRFLPRDGGDGDALTRAVTARVQRDGTCWAGGTTWHGLAAMRISVSGWATTEADIDQSAAAILAAYEAERRLP